MARNQNKGNSNLSQAGRELREGSSKAASELGQSSHGGQRSNKGSNK